MPDESLLTDDIRALIGQRTDLGATRITLRDVKRATEVFTGEPGPDFTEGDEVPGWVLAALDGESDSPPEPRLLPQSILISNEWTFDRPLRLGETLRLSSVISNITERFGGRFGYALDFRTDTEYRDASGAVVATDSSNMMYYDVSTSERDS